MKVERALVETHDTGKFPRAANPERTWCSWSKTTPCCAASLERELNSIGFAVLTARDGDAAVEAIKHHSFDVVLTDIEMPGLPAWTCCAWCARTISTCRW